MKPILDAVKPGEEALILNLLYYKPWPIRNRLNNQSDPYKEDSLMIVYKDKNSKKHLKIIPKPKQEIFFTKPEHKHLWKYTRDSVERDLLYPVQVRPKDIIKRIYEELKDDNDEHAKYLKEIYKKSYETNEPRTRQELHKYAHVLMSDFTIEESYRLNLALQYNLEARPKIRRSFMDIETDVFGLSTAERGEMNMDRINALSLVLDYNPKDPKDETIQVYGLFLRDYNTYPNQKEWEDNLDEFYRAADKLFNNRELTINGAKVVHDQKYKIHISIFDSEVELLRTYFEMINTVNPDTNAIWNIAFDIPKIISRAIILGLDPVDLISHPMFPEGMRYIDVHIDRRPGVLFSNNNTSITGTVPYLFIDHMLLYAGMTKGSPSPSHALDYVLNRELGIGKVDFGKGVDVINASRKNYFLFALYSLNDTVLMQVLDHYLGHIEMMIYNTQVEACSPLQTIRPTKEMRQYYSLQKMRRWDLIPGNNDNIDYLQGITDELYEFMNQQTVKQDEDGEIIEDEIDEDELTDARRELLKNAKDLTSRLEDTIASGPRKLGGGLVTSPMDNNYNGSEILGRRSRHFYRFAADMDFASEYPNVKISRNLGKETEIGRLVIGQKISDEQDMFKNKVYLPGAEFVSDFIAKDWISMGRAYFNLPSVEELLKKYGDL